MNPVTVNVARRASLGLLVLWLGFGWPGRAANQVIAWGDNSQGQTNLPQGLTNIVAISAWGSQNLALRADGTVTQWGFRLTELQVPEGLTNAIAISCGGDHNLALRADGTVLAWGRNYYGQTNVPSGLSDVVAISAGQLHSVALRSDGTVIAWGGNMDQQTNVPSGLRDVVAVAAGGAHCLALRADGTVTAWGNMAPWEAHTYRRIVVPAGLRNVVAIAGGWSHDLALRADETVLAWGANDYGQTNVPPDLTNVIAIAAVANQSIAVRGDGGVVAWGKYYVPWVWLPATVPDGLNHAVAVAGGVSHTLALIGQGPPLVDARLADRQVAREVGSVSFYAPAVGELPLTYQWRCNGTNIDRATNAWLTLTAVQPEQAGLYSLVVSNAQGTTIGAAANLEVVPAFLTQQPGDVVSYRGGTARFEVVAYGGEPMRYQWRFNNEDLEGQTNAVLTLTGLGWADDGEYSVMVGNRSGTTSSRRARLAVNNVVAWGAGGPGTSPDLPGLPHYGQSTVPAGLTNVVGIVGAEFISVALKADGTARMWGAAGDAETNALNALNDVVAVAVASAHALALRSDGTVIATSAHSTVGTHVPADLTNVVAVSARYSGNSLALRKDGTVVAWSVDREGSMTVVPGLSNVVAIAADWPYNLALRADGTLAAWGEQAVTPTGLSNVVAIAIGTRNLALRADGMVAMWSGSSSTPAAIRGGLSNVVAIAAGDGGYDHNLALKADGSLTAWGANAFGMGVIPPGLTNVAAIASGGAHNLALVGVGPPVLTEQWADRQVIAEVGTVIFRAQAVGEGPLSYQWQCNGTNVPGATQPWLVLTHVQPEQAGQYTVVVRNALGTAVSSRAQLTVIPALITREPQDQGILVGQPATFVVQAQGGESLHYQWRSNGMDLAGETNAALVVPAVDWAHEGGYSVRVSTRFGAVSSREARLVVCRVAAWGENSRGQTNVPPGLSNVVAVAGGGEHSLALRADGTLIGWGDSQYGQTSIPEAATNVVAIAAGWAHSLALRSDGRVIAWGYNYFGQSNVPGGLGDVVGIACGGHHNLALRRDGTVIGWGYDYAGVTNVPPGVSNAIAVAAGGLHSLVLLADGTVVAWGHRNLGEWILPSGLRDVVALADGGYHTLALRADGTVTAWGANWYGMATVPTWWLTNAVAIAAGLNHSVALRPDGNVVVWGSNESRQRRAPLGLSNVVAIAAGGYHNLAILGPPIPLTVTTQPPASDSPSFRQTGLLWQGVRLFNTTAFSFPAVRVMIQGLPTNTVVYNASGTNTLGQPCVQYNQPLAPGASVDLTIEYHTPTRSIPTTALTAEVVEPTPPLEPAGTPQDIARSFRLDDDSYLIDFRTLANRTYYVQYSSDLASWKTAFPPVAGSGSTMQWMDNGPPKTDSHPRTQTNRFYRVLMVP